MATTLKLGRSCGEKLCGEWLGLGVVKWDREWDDIKVVR